MKMNINPKATRPLNSGLEAEKRAAMKKLLNKKQYPVVIKVEYWRQFKNGKTKHVEIDYKYPKYGFQFYKKLNKKASESEKFVLKEVKMWNFKPDYEPLLISATQYVTI